jgi:hypothetical protein
MATLCRSYPSEAAARRAIEALRQAGLPPQGAHLIIGGALHDLRREPVGEFAGRAAPDAPVGTFGNTTIRRWRPGGSFAGNPDRRREGSFADVDGHVLVRCGPDGREHHHVAGLRDLRALLVAAGVEPEVTDKALTDLCAGAALVLVQIAKIGPVEAEARLEEARQAA